MAAFQNLIFGSILLLLTFGNEIVTVDENKDVLDLKNSTVVISVLVRNKAHTLPYFLTCLERLDYPKDRILLW